MNDLLDTTAAAVHDPLVVALAVFALVGLLTHLLFRMHPFGRATTA